MCSLQYICLPLSLEVPNKCVMGHFHSLELTNKSYCSENSDFNLYFSWGLIPMRNGIPGFCYSFCQIQHADKDRSRRRHQTEADSALLVLRDEDSTYNGHTQSLKERRQSQKTTLERHAEHLGACTLLKGTSVLLSLKPESLICSIKSCIFHIYIYTSLIRFRRSCTNCN